jgi:hypothetical protein
VPPVITSPVAHTTVSLGESVEFRCEASGDNLTYQWINEKTGAPIPGACHSVYRINECSMMDFGSYVCSVQNEAGLVSQSDMYIVRRRHNQGCHREYILVIVGLISTISVSVTACDPSR